MTQPNEYESILLNNIKRNEADIEKKQAFIDQEAPKLVEINLDKLRDLIDKKKDLIANIASKENEKVHLTCIRSMLSDDAIKAFVIKKYLPVINKLLVYYLNKMNSEIIFEFDEEFNEVITNRFKEDFTYHSCSEGQKRRIDLAVLFTFVEFCKTKYPLASSNLLILDEVTAGLDIDGENDLFQILREINKTEDKSIVVISHSTAINSAYVDKTYEVIMKKKFSKIREVR